MADTIRGIHPDQQSSGPSTPNSIGSGSKVGSGYDFEDLVDTKTETRNYLEEQETLKTASLKTHLEPLEKQLEGLKWHEPLKKRVVNQEIERVKTAHNQALHAIYQAERALGGAHLDKETQTAIYSTAVENPERFKIVADFLSNPRKSSTKTSVALGSGLKNPEDTDTVERLNSLVKMTAPNRAATRIQSLLRGNQARKKTVFPSEIKNFLDTNLTGLTAPNREPLDSDVLSKAIAREILELSTSGAMKEHGVLLDTGKSYQFQSGEVTIPIEIWVKQTANGVEIDMVGQKLGQGTYKTVFASRTFDIDLSTQRHDMSPLQNTVTVQSNEESSNLNLLEGMEIIQENFSKDLENKTIRLAGVVTHGGKLVNRVRVKGNRSKEVNGEQLTVARDIQYDGDLDATQNPKILLQAFSDTAQTLLQFHAKGIVHRDVKPPNILTRKGRGILADFDLTKKQGFNTDIDPNEYKYWDPLSQNCYVTPFSDAHGLARSMCEKLFGATYRDSEDSIRTLPRFKNPPPELKAIRDAIAAIFDANKKTLRYLNQNPQIEAQLADKNSLEVLKGIAVLQKEFPAYKQFLELMAHGSDPR